jgi:uracil-DNA glycosylase
MLLDIDKSWNPILHYLYEEPLLTLKDKILPSISFQPKAENIFRIYRVPVNNIKVVILGQDPYPTPMIGIGRAFAVSEETKMPVSLRNIRKEIEAESIKITLLEDEWKTLEHWERQGIFLLNTALTIETGMKASHISYWKNFIIATIRHISYSNPCIWLLWGNYAQSFSSYILNRFFVKQEDVSIKDKTNYVLTAAHPAAEAYKTNAGFFGCDHFRIVNEIIKKKNQLVINF